ncbi:p-loop containing nucleoside triphosphate hydrolase [Pleurostoma richardsiae]|uniref:P-loop containing nucleoside triphosphate hydrolase n=1 Tax=Pleurostoma richardsiae TaxID=41990 RepID=A0AA38R2S2_9PEZI|nr:p-loop containing nucleoside triphosphate hydrolase [Pleurostoma richardsiae]
MEALVAVGLAGNVVQFVQFASQLIQEAISIRRSGSPSSAPELRKLADSLTRQAQVLRTQLATGAQAQSLGPEDKYVLDVAAECEDAGNKFVAYLDEFIKQNPSTKPKVLQSVQASFKFFWRQQKIDEFAAKLDKLRSALSLGTILALRTTTTDYSDRILMRLRDLQVAGKVEAEQTVESRRAVQSLIDIIQEDSWDKLDTIQSHVRECLDKLDSLRHGLPQETEKGILRWLNFRQMSWRFEEVPLAYQKTFEWIYREPSDATWDDLSAHLGAENVCKPYWINGKAGSGKSTLMKFILHDFRTKKALKRWAGDDTEPVLIRFFFWNLGTSLQKSNTGMLRALMHAVLDRHPELIPAVFPSLYQNWDDSEADSQPTYVEMKRAFELLVEKSASFLKICIFIDGIDEFEGNHKDICMFLRSLVSTCVKLVVSSRPISACVSVFKGCPTLRLQDLTKRDMEIFVKGNLSSHESMVQLTKRFPQDACELVAEIKSKADGVFLWVKLVVRLLVDGLEAGDDMKDLRKKLRLLPPDLRDLYRRMMEKMQPEYQVQAAELFQLFQTWNLVTADEPFRTLTLAFAFQEPAEALKRDVGPLDLESSDWLHDNTEARIRSRCCGLIEVHRKHLIPRSGLQYAGRINQSVVNYMHRTVAEFLLSEDVWEEVCAKTQGSRFDPVRSLTYASLSMMKVEDGYKETGGSGPFRYLITLTKFLRRDFRLQPAEFTEVVDSADSTMARKRLLAHDQGISGISNRFEHWAADFFPVRTVVSSSLATFRQLGDVFGFAATAGLLPYIETLDGFKRQSYLFGYTLVVHALESWLPSPDFTSPMSLHERSDTLTYLLENAAKPEDAGLATCGLC